jgi:hypothetical protein
VADGNLLQGHVLTKSEWGRELLNRIIVSCLSGVIGDLHLQFYT